MNTESTECKLFYEAIMANDDMLQKIAKNPADFQIAMEKIQEITNGYVPVGNHIKLMEAISYSITETTQSMSYFSDNDILKLIQSYYQKWFNLENFRERPHADNPIFGSIQKTLTTLAELGYSKSFEYLITNVEIEKYDHDGLSLLVALRNKRHNILALIAIHSNRETYGTTGSLKHMISPHIRAEYIRCKQYLSTDTIIVLDTFGILSVQDQLIQD